MGNELVEDIVNFIDLIEWPDECRVSEEAGVIFEKGLDKLDGYRGHPDVLFDALEIFVATGTCAYGYAGVASVMINASFLQGDEYYEPGLDYAMQWLKKAQELAPDQIEFGCIELNLLLCLNELEKAYSILEQLEKKTSKNYRVCGAAIAYWGEVNDMEKVKYWCSKAKQVANTEEQRELVARILADRYMMSERYEEALVHYEKISQTKTEDPWLWHNMSILYCEVEEFEKARTCNQNALNLMEFGVAREMKEYIDSVL